MEQQMKSQKHLAPGHIHQTHGATGFYLRPALMQLSHQLRSKQISQAAFETQQAELLKGWTKQRLYFLRRQKYISAADFKRLRPNAPIFAVRA